MLFENWIFHNCWRPSEKMAAAELKRNQVLHEEINIKQDASSFDCKKKIENCRFRILDMILYIFSIGIILTNIVTGYKQTSLLLILLLIF